MAAHRSAEQMYEMDENVRDRECESNEYYIRVVAIHTIPSWK